MLVVHRLLAAAAILLPCAALADPIPASDFGLLITAASTSTVSTVDNVATTTTTPGNNVVRQVKSATRAGQIDLTTYALAAGDGFYFKQDVNVLGNGSASSTTTLDLTFTNTQANAQHIVFFSDVEPGHFGYRQAGNDRVSGSIDFNVSLKGGATLFQASYGLIGDPATNDYYTSNRVTNSPTNSFNGTSNYSTNTYFVNGKPVKASARDWWTNRFYIDLGLFQPNEVKTVLYASTVSASVTNSSGSCTDLADIGTPIGFNSKCSGVNVTFIDPRHSGGVVGANVVTVPGAPGSPIVGFAGNPFFNPIRAYQTNRPQLPQEIPPFTPNYGGAPGGGSGGGGGTVPPPPVSTPEPAAIALLALGVAALASRRKR